MKPTKTRVKKWWGEGGMTRGGGGQKRNTERERERVIVCHGDVNCYINWFFFFLFYLFLCNYILLIQKNGSRVSTLTLNAGNRLICPFNSRWHLWLTPREPWLLHACQSSRSPLNAVTGRPSPAVYHFHQEWGKMDALKASSPFKRSFNEGGRGCQACTWVIVPSTTTTTGINHCPTLN